MIIAKIKGGKMRVTKKVNRRDFLENSAFGLFGAVALGGKSLQTPEVKGEVQPAKIREYRTLGRTGFKVSDISSGGPTDEGVLNALLDAGVNYIDTAESYGNGQSERIVGQVLKKRDRKSFFVTTKLELNEVPGKKEEVTKEGILRRFRKSLERMQSEYADCLMIHAPGDVETVKSEAFHAAVAELKTEGRLKFTGISYHGSQDFVDTGVPMDKILNTAAEDGRFDVMLLAHNFLKEDNSEEVLKICQEKKVGTTLMKTNPVGNYLMIKAEIENLEKDGKEKPDWAVLALKRMREKYEKAEPFIKEYNLADPVEIRKAAIRFCLNDPRVNSICVTFDNFEALDTYVRLSGTRLSPIDKKTLAAYAHAFGGFYCRHSCGLCESRCPQKIPINQVMRYNHYFEAQGREKYAMEKYSRLDLKKENPCQNCSGACESVCPYGVSIQALLMIAHRNLTWA